MLCGVIETAQCGGAERLAAVACRRSSLHGAERAAKGHFDRPLFVIWSFNDA
jgi:hypothetical protein